MIPHKKSPKITIYTDGACDPNPGPGGWAVLIRSGKHEKIFTGSNVDTTNNRMELTAAIEAFKVLKPPCSVAFYTDSKYLKRGITEWLPIWQQRNWRRKSGSLANIDLWKALDLISRQFDVDWHWVPSHATNPYNQRVDYLARRAIQK